MNNKHKLWVEKYRPKNLEDYIFPNAEMEKSIRRMVSDETIPHLIFSGVQGTGKTTLAFILIEEMGIDPMDVLTLNASDENSVDVLREKIKGFVMTHSMSDFKIVHLEEADYISLNAQAILRRLMEEFADNARFVLTCNHENRIIPAVRSRCQHFRFEKMDYDSVLEYVYKNVLKKEKVKVKLDALEKYVAAGYPDIRKIINLLQQNTIDGVLTLGETTSNTDYKIAMLELIGEDKWDEARELVTKEVPDQEWEGVYRILYENLSKSGKFTEQEKWEDGIIVLAEHLYKHTIVAHPDINVAAMFIKLAQI